MKYLISLAAILAILYPFFIWYGRVGINLAIDETLALSLFPVFGLLAFSIMWLHIVGGALLIWLERYIDFAKFVSKSSVAVLILIIAHPLTLFWGIGYENRQLIFDYYDAKYIWLAVIAWVILVSYDIARKFKNRHFSMKHWETVKLISTIGFFFALSHSFGLGSDLQAGPLRSIWVFYGVTAIIATIYTYGVKKFFK